MGGVPYPKIPFDEVKQFLSSGKRLEKPDHCPDDIYGIMLECWKEIPEHRPSFEDIKESFRNLLVLKVKYHRMLEISLYCGSGTFSQFPLLTSTYAYL